MTARSQVQVDSGKTLTSETSKGVERMLPGLRSRLAGARRLAMRQMLVQRLRRLAARPDWLIATKLFGEMVTRAGTNASARALLESATLRAARAAESAGEWSAACRFWIWHATASPDPVKAVRNLARCARAITKSRSDQKSIRDALEAWQYLLTLDPESEDGRQGVAWCSTSLARMAEQEANFTKARLLWTSVLELYPNDEAGLDGLRRTIQLGAAAAPAATAEQVERWQALNSHLKKMARPDYRSQYFAGRELFAAGAPELAIPFLERALSQRAGGDAALLLCRCQLAAARYDAAALTLEVVRSAGLLSQAPPQDVQIVFARATPAVFRDALLVAAASCFASSPQMVAVLVPLLVGRGLRIQILELTDAVVDRTGNWSDSIVLDTAAYLAGIGEQDRALRLLSVFSAAPVIRAAFLTCAERYQPDVLELAMFAAGDHPEKRLGAYVALAEHYAHKGNYPQATDILCRAGGSVVDSSSFYASNKDRLAILIAELIRASGASQGITEQLARLIVFWASDAAKTFFSSPEFANIRGELAIAAKYADAPGESRSALLGEGYYRHHLERRERLDCDELKHDFRYCDAALRYFKTVAELRPVELIPVSSELRNGLTAPCLPLSSGRFADLLMSYAIIRERPDFDLRSPVLFERALGWYVGRFMAANKVPSACLAAEAIAHFNRVVHDHSSLGVRVTRFTQFLRTGAAKDLYRLDNGLDALLFTLDAVASNFRLNPHYRPFLSDMLPPLESACSSLFDACVTALSDPIDSARAAGRPLSQLIALRPREEAPVGGANIAGPRDVLVIGHEGHGTGLGRNFAMLTQALEGDDIALAALEYETEPNRFADRLKAWRDGCQSEPIVIAAVNAHDIPALFLRDRYNALDRCHVAGFFLWETSQAPRVQRLGIQLVDEVWAPTQYVADIYSGFTRVHVVGKGLFSKDAWPEAIGRTRGETIRFLTVFDFHSSVERKNPLASVLAFQRAFSSGEDVELIIKASNVNPQHPGNASGQWEKVCAAAESDRRVRIVKGRYTEEQMQRLMRATSCVVSLHRAEGFGYVLSDAMAHGLPVIATAYSGNVDFCDSETSFPVAYRLVPVKSYGSHWEAEGALWAEPDIDSAAAQMQRVYRDYPGALQKASVARRTILSKYSKETFAQTLRRRLHSLCNPVSGGVDLMHSAVQ